MDVYGKHRVISQNAQATSCECWSKTSRRVSGPTASFLCPET